MDRYVVIGHPVEHSRSPAIHARFAALTGQTLVYERLLAPLDGFTATVQDGDGDPIVFVITRQGLRWRLTDIRLPL